MDDNEFSWIFGIEDYLSKPLDLMKDSISKFSKQMDRTTSAFRKQVVGISSGLDKINKVVGGKFKSFWTNFGKGMLPKATLAMKGFAKQSKEQLKYFMWVAKHPTLWKPFFQDTAKRFTSLSKILQRFKKETKQLPMPGDKKKPGGPKGKGDDSSGLLGKAAAFASGPFSRIGGFFKKQADAFDELGISLGGVIGIITSLSFGVAIAKLINLTNEYSNSIKSLMTEMSGFSKNFSAASASLNEFSGYLGQTREAVSDIVKTGVGFGMLADGVKDAGKNLKLFTRDTIELSVATGLAGESAADYNFRLGKLYGLGFQKLRNFGAGFKYIGDQTRISSGDLNSFTEGLDELMALFPKLSPEKKGSMVLNLQAMAGALSDMNIDGSKFTGMFEKMTEEAMSGSNALINTLDAVSGGLFDSTKALDLIKKGDFASLFKEMAKGLKGIPVDVLPGLVDTMKEEGIDLSLGDIFKLQGFDPSTFDKLLAGQAKAVEKADYLKQIGDAMSDSLHGPWIKFSEQVKTFLGGSKLGQGLLSFVKNLSTTITTKLMDALTATGQWFSDNGPLIDQFLKDVNIWFDKAVDFIINKSGEMFAWLKKKWPEIKAVALDVWDAINKAFKVFVNDIWPAVKGAFEGLAELWNALSGDEKKIVGTITAIGVAMSALVIAGGPFALVVAGFGAISLAIAGIAKFSKEASDNMTGIGMAFGLSGKKARDFADDYDNLKDVISRRNESVMLSERDPASRDVHKKNTGEFNNQIEKMIQKMSDGVPADKLPKFWSEMYGQTGVTPPPQIQKVIDNWNKYRLNQTPAMPEVATQEKRPEAAAAVADVKVKEPVVKEIPRSIPEARKPDLSKSEESFKKALDQSEIVDQLASVNSNLLTLISKMGGGKTSPAKLNATVTVESGLAAFAGGTIPR